MSSSFVTFCEHLIRTELLLNPLYYSDCGESSAKVNFIKFTARKPQLHSRKPLKAFAKVFSEHKVVKQDFERCSGEQATMLESHHGGLVL